MSGTDDQNGMDDLLTPAGLGTFFVPFPDGRPMARVGLRMSFYFRRVAEPALRHGLLACVKDYLDLSGPVMRSWKLADDRGWRKLKPGEPVGLTRAEQRLKRPNFSLTMSEVADEPGEAAAWSFTSLSSNITGRAGQLGYFVAHFPFTVLDGAPEGMFRTLFARWCDRLSPEHAYGGMGWIIPVEVGARNTAVAQLGELANRFVALDLDDVNGVAIRCQDGIKCVAWLTAVSTRILAKVKGAEAVLKAAGPGIVARPYANGTIFQAGPLPSVGDKAASMVPDDMIALGRALKAARAPYNDTMFDAPPGYVAPGGEEPKRYLTQQWLTRFDGA